MQTAVAYLSAAELRAATQALLLAPELSVVSSSGAVAEMAYSVDALLDSCGSKGTGKWTIQQAADLGVPCSTHAAALEARYLSSLKSQRGEASTLYAETAQKGGALPDGWKADLEDALLASKLCSYAQGMAHLRAVSDEHGWDLQLSELACIWQGGCIIRAEVLHLVEAAFAKNPQLTNLLLDADVAAPSPTSAFSSIR